MADLMSYGRTLLKPEDVMDGVAEMIEVVEIEATSPDGTKLVSVHNPIETTEKLKPGEYFFADGDLTLNEGAEDIELDVTNTADRPIQVGSHFHFFEVNKYLKFDRRAPRTASASTLPPVPPCASSRANRTACGSSTSVARARSTGSVR